MQWNVNKFCAYWAESKTPFTQHTSIATARAQNGAKEISPKSITSMKTWINFGQIKNVHLLCHSRLVSLCLHFHYSSVTSLWGPLLVDWPPCSVLGLPAEGWQCHPVPQSHSSSHPSPPAHNYTHTYTNKCPLIWASLHQAHY